jgi:uncharacterized protein YggT (Ycf19 family)
MPGPNLLAHWYYHVPDLILAALLWLLTLRLVLLLLPSRGDNSAMHFLRAVTEPIVKVVGFVTPQLVPAAVVVLFAAAWLLAARIALFLAVSAAGVRLSMN